MNDILPSESANWQHIERVYRRVLAQFSYQEIRFPILEETQLFKRSVGEVTDIVEKEMYTFLDRNKMSLTLRPEGTAGCVRACEQHGLLYNQVQRLFYAGPMFRYERPQKGRLRQFHQLGVEAFGMAGTDIELELILLCANLFKQLGIEEQVTLEINSIGDSHGRASFGKDLKAYLDVYRTELDKDSQARLDANPLRILDSKDEKTQQILRDAPRLSSYLSEDSRQRFERFTNGLDSLDIKYRINPALVRGLDYYNDLVFEWTSDCLGAQATVCAGGRYDALVEKLGGRPVPAVGFAIGIERLLLMLETLGKVPDNGKSCDIFIVYLGEQSLLQALALADAIRKALVDKRVMLNCGGASLKSQLKKADKSGADYALIIGEQEVENQTVQFKSLRLHQETEHLSEEALIKRLLQ